MSKIVLTSAFDIFFLIGHSPLFRPPEEEDCEAVDNPDPLGADEHEDDGRTFFFS